MTVGLSKDSASNIAPGDNATGAIIFFAYIVAALTFTSVIVRDIVILSLKQGHRVRKIGLTAKHSNFRHVSFCAAAAVVSFSVLSWNMLRFLLISYVQWAEDYGIVACWAFTGSTELREQAWYVWAWATSSTLFKTFAEDLLRDTSVWRWTVLSLLYHYACNIYISANGCRYCTRHLWAYFVLNQILPVSFTQNLFLTTMALVTNDSEAARTPQSANRLLRFCAVIFFVGMLLFVPSTLQSRAFIPALLLTRATLFAPFLLDLISYGNTVTDNSSSEDRVRSSNLCCLLILAAFGIYSMLDSSILVSVQTRSTIKNYAAATLSNDLLIGFASSLLYKIV